MQLQRFKYENMNDLTTLEIDGEIWFVANEVCKALDINNSRQALTRLDEDEKNTVIINDGIRGNPNKAIISESGLYALVLSSNKLEAKKFRKWITSEVIPRIRKTGSYENDRPNKSNFITWYDDNWDSTDKGYFSVLSELYIRLYGIFEKVGYIIPDKAFNGKEIRPDVSVDKTFANYLDANYPEQSNDHKPYTHVFSKTGLEVPCRQYKSSLLGIFAVYIDEVWIPSRAEAYFKKRDPIALEYLPKLIG